MQAPLKDLGVDQIDPFRARGADQRGDRGAVIGKGAGLLEALDTGAAQHKAPARGGFAGDAAIEKADPQRLPRRAFRAHPRAARA